MMLARGSQGGRWSWRALAYAAKRLVCTIHSWQPGNGLLLGFYTTLQGKTFRYLQTSRWTSLPVSALPRDFRVDVI